MTRRVLGELDRSKLLNELELMPAPEKRRIDAATGAGRMLDDRTTATSNAPASRSCPGRERWVRWPSPALP